MERPIGGRTRFVRKSPGARGYSPLKRCRRGQWIESEAGNSRPKSALDPSIIRPAGTHTSTRAPPLGSLITARMALRWCRVPVSALGTGVMPGAFSTSRNRHCEERSDEAIRGWPSAQRAATDCFVAALLAMTINSPPARRPSTERLKARCAMTPSPIFPQGSPKGTCRFARAQPERVPEGRVRAARTCRALPVPLALQDRSALDAAR